MCLMLYLGTERPIAPSLSLGPLRLARLDHDAAPTALRDQASVYQLGTRLAQGAAHADAAQTGASAEPPPLPRGIEIAPEQKPPPPPPLGCACVFRDTDESASIAAYAGLRRLFSDILTGPRDSAALLGCWSGEERYQPSVEMAISVAEISAEIELFSDVIHGWPILLRVTAPTAARRAVAAGDR